MIERPPMITARQERRNRHLAGPTDGALLPTPISRNHKMDRWTPAKDARVANNPKHTPGLDVVVSKAMLPTPVVTSNFNRKGLSEKSGDGLGTVVFAALHPTPVSQSADRGLRAGGGSRARKVLNQLYPSDLPPSSEPRALSGLGGARALLTITEWLMGYDPGWLASAFPPTATLSSRTSRKPSA